MLAMMPFSAVISIYVLISLKRCRMMFHVARMDFSIQQCLKGQSLPKAPNIPALPSGLPRLAIVLRSSRAIGHAASPRISGQPHLCHPLIVRF
jgi:hypothetical protein